MSGIHLGKQYADRLGRYTLTLASPTYGESLAGVYDGTETFTATLCRGESRPVDATLAAEWDSSISGNPASLAEPKVLLTVDPDALDGLTEYGLYYVKVWLTASDVDVLPAGSTIEILPPAGSESAPRTYCSLDDVRDVCPWIERAIQAHPTAQIDLAEQRGMAAEWIDDTAVSRYRSLLDEWREKGIRPGYPAVSEAQITVITDAFSDQDNPISYLTTALRTALAADGLKVDAEADSRVRRAAAYRAAYRLLDSMRFHGDSGKEYADAADRYAARSLNLLSGAVLRIDLDDDADVDIELS